jgi:hypothetical protein
MAIDPTQGAQPNESPVVAESSDGHHDETQLTATQPDVDPGDIDTESAHADGATESHERDNKGISSDTDAPICYRFVCDRAHVWGLASAGLP